MLILLAIALAPTVLIIIYILKFDRYQREPVNLLVKLFIGGMVSVIPALILETVMSNVIGSIFGYASFLIYTLVTAFIGVALIEEGCKYAFAKIISYRKPSFDELYDGMIYCVMSSLGFATVENVLYVLNYGLSTGIVRAITAVPGHAMFALAMGYYMSLSKFDPQNASKHRLKSLLIPTVIHGIYDAILMLGYDWCLLAFVPLMIFLYKNAIAYVKKISEIAPVAGYEPAYEPQYVPQSQPQMTYQPAPGAYYVPQNAQAPQAPTYQAPVYQAPVYQAPQAAAPAVKYCIHCGKPMDPAAKFCPDCGTKQE